MMGAPEIELQVGSSCAHLDGFFSAAALTQHVGKALFVDFAPSRPSPRMPMLPIAAIAIVCAALFTGAAGYISLVEHPARLQLANAPLLAQWQPSYARALPIQSGLAIAGGVAGIAAWLGSGGPLWLAGSLVLLANWPFTLVAIFPVNRQLKGIRPDQAGPESRALLLSWGRLHDVRSVLGAASTAMFAWSLSTVV